MVISDLFVHQTFDSPQLISGDRLEVDKIEAQPLRVNQ